ncbi:MAG: hypothetical protein IJ958_08575 [Agathobacter sp.]|nr:hypothetical protein [Agathobacter sp.]
MLEVYVLVEKKKSLIMKIVTVLLFVIGAYFLYATFRGLIIYFAVAIPFLAIAWYIHTKYTEFEYSYFDGEFRFAKIFNKQKRKELRGYNVEDVIVIAPEGDRSLHNYEKNPQVKTRDLSSGYKNEGKVYCLVAKTEERYEMTKFEPDERYLDAVCIKYRQKVIR